MKRNRERGSIVYDNLNQAVKNKQLSIVQELLLAREDEDAPNVNAFDEDGMTPLHNACQDDRFYRSSSSSLGIIKLLLEHGANINSKDSEAGSTPLHLALCHQRSNNNYYLERIKLLIEKGADPNAKTNDGDTPFNRACSSSGGGTYLLEILMLLIENGADINLKDYYGRTPLHWACRNGDFEMFKFLINNGADASSPIFIGSIKFFREINPAFPPAKRERSRPVQALMEKLLDNNNDVNADYYRRCYYRLLPPLHWACLNDHFDMVQFLIENGGEDVGVLLQAKDEYGMTPLHWPSFVGSLEMVQFLMSRGAKANTKSKHRWTPLYFACNENHLDVVWFLVRQDPSLDLPTSLE